MTIHKTQRTYVLASFLIFAGMLFVPAMGADTPAQRISFRTVKPVSAHVHSDKELAELTKTLKQLGCASKEHAHDGHVDLQYECPFWRSITVKDVAEADRWDKWLSSKGFAVVRNTPDETHKETVKYHLADWKTYHFEKPLVTTAHVEMFKMLGCEVKQEKHEGHDDVTVRCAGWQTIGVPNHAEAHGWMQVLQKLGFETLHEH